MYVFFDLGIAPHFPEFRFEVSHTFQKQQLNWLVNIASSFI